MHYLEIARNQIIPLQRENIVREVAVNVDQLHVVVARVVDPSPAAGPLRRVFGGHAAQVRPVKPAPHQGRRFIDIPGLYLPFCFIILFIFATLLGSFKMNEKIHLLMISKCLSIRYDIAFFTKGVKRLIHFY